MKKLNVILTLLLFVFCSYPVSAQYLIDQTYYTPTTFQTYNEPVDIVFQNGYRFVGTKNTTTANGSVINISYHGSAIFPDGGRIITEKGGDGFDENLRFTTGTCWEISPNGELTETRYGANGETLAEIKLSRKYVIEDNCIVFPKTAEEIAIDAAIYGGYNSGYDSGSNSNSGSSDYDRHTAICAGCGGSGSCGYCSGNGWTLVNGNRVKCGRCHGTGRCQSCAGTGKKHGIY